MLESLQRLKDVDGLPKYVQQWNRPIYIVMKYTAGTKFRTYIATHTCMHAHIWAAHVHTLCAWGIMVHTDLYHAVCM